MLFRSCDEASGKGDPECGVSPGGIVEIAIELRIRLEAELSQRVDDERGESRGVLRLERHDVDSEPLEIGRVDVHELPIVSGSSNPSSLVARVLV